MPAMAEQCRRGPAADSEPAHGPRSDPGSLCVGVGGRERDLHSQLPGVDPKARQALAAGGNDLGVIPRIDDQPEGQSEIRQEATDALDIVRCTSALADADQSPE